MADAPVVHIGENSPEEVAYKLFRDIARAEGHTPGLGQITADEPRAYILDMYAECLKTVKGERR